MWWTVFKYLLVGAIFWIVGVFVLGGSQGFVARSEPAQLMVLQVDSRWDDEGYRIYRPVFGLHTAARPRPEYAGNTWMRPAPHRAGDIVPGRYDRQSGEMRSDRMMQTTIWIAWIVKILGILAVLQAMLMLFGVPEVLLPLRVRIGS